MKTVYVVLMLLGAAQGSLGLENQGLGAWRQGATPAKLTPPVPAEACACAPDPILPDPACILCLCDVEMAGAVSDKLPERNTTSCEIVGAVPTTISYSTGASAECLCAQDPFFKNTAQFQLCKCPKATAEAVAEGTKERREDAPAGVVVPNPELYSAWPAASRDSPSLQEWPRCKGNYALCSMANCTLDFAGADDSPILLAECGCIIPTDDNGMTDESFVDPTYILDADLKDQTDGECPEGAGSEGCGAENATPICKAITANTIYGGEYDFISTFANSSELGGFDKFCERPEEGGLYAQCMTAACYQKEAFDGSPITCYCPVYNSTRYILGSPLGVEPDCKPNLPYILSGVDAGSGDSSNSTDSKML